jgi:hypothetical protein
MTVSDAFVARTSRPNAYVALTRQVFGPNLLIPVALAQLVCLLAGWILGLPAVPFAALVLLPGPLFLAAAAVARRHRWPAQEAVIWLNLIAADKWAEKYGQRIPATPGRAKTWLARHPAGAAPDSAIAVALLEAGRLVEAREVASRLPTGSAHERHQRLEIELALAAHTGQSIDTSAADEATREDTEIGDVERVLELAYHAAALAIDQGGDGIAPLAAGRLAAGPMPVPYRKKVLLARFWNVAASLAIGLWLLAAVLVGMATAGGVVWF